MRVVGEVRVPGAVSVVDVVGEVLVVGDVLVTVIRVAYKKNETNLTNGMVTNQAVMVHVYVTRLLHCAPVHFPQLLPNENLERKKDVFIRA